MSASKFCCYFESNLLDTNSEFLTAVNTKITVIRNVTPCSSVDGNKFKRIFFPQGTMATL